ncbi:MAG: phage integrase SAM-like domain-containing protein [Aureispira sp.]
MTIGKRIKKILEKENKTIVQLAKELDVHSNSLRAVINDKALPSSKILIPLAQKGIVLNWILDENYQGSMYLPGPDTIEDQAKAIIPKALHEAVYEILIFKKQTVRQRTYDCYSSAAGMFLKFKLDCPISDIQKKDIIAFRDYILKTRSTRTTNNYVSYLSTIFKEAIQRDYLINNPCSNIPKLRHDKLVVDRYYTRKQQKAILAHVRQDTELWLCVRFLYYCFIRPNEFRQLRVCHIDTTNNKLFIPGAIAKNRRNSYRAIPHHFNNQLKKELAGRVSNHYLVSPDGGSSFYSKNTLSTRHRKILRKLNLFGKGDLYSWKHTGMCAAHQNGIGIEWLKQQADHHKQEVTEVYLKSLGMRPNHAILNKMPPLME